jgi:hypothetical protein
MTQQRYRRRAVPLAWVSNRETKKMFRFEEIASSRIDLPRGDETEDKTSVTN